MGIEPDFSRDGTGTEGKTARNQRGERAVGAHGSDKRLGASGQVDMFLKEPV